jgi:hypothetical protein
MVHGDGRDAEMIGQREPLTVEDARDRIIIGLRAGGMGWRKIGQVLGMSPTTIRRRWREIPREARRYYGGLRAMA